MLARLVIVSLVFALQSACASRMPRPTRSDAVTDSRLLLGNIAEKETASARDQLTRSCSQEYSNYVLWTGLTYEPLTLRQAEIRKYISDESPRKKWKKKEAEALLKKELEIAAKGDQKYTCFAVEVETNDPLATDSKGWKGEVIDESGKTTSLTFQAFKGFDSKKIETIIFEAKSKSIDPSPLQENLHLTSKACMVAGIKPTTNLTVKVEPQYKKGLTPCELKWRNAK